MIRDAGQRWFLRRAHKEPTLIDIPLQLAKSKNILILLPEKEPEFRQAIDKRSELQAFFPGAHFQFVKSGDLRSSQPITRDQSCIDWLPTDLDLWGLPGHRIKERIYNRPFDLVLDLSLSFSFMNLAFAHYANAPLKLCFSHPQRERVYNFLISFSTPPSWGQAFQALGRHVTCHEQLA